MKPNYLLLLLLLSAFTAFAQTPKKIRAINFVGVELGRDEFYYNYAQNSTKLITAADFEKFLPDNSVFSTYFADQQGYVDPLGNWDGPKWAKYSGGVNLSALLAFGNKNKSAINPHHVLQIGLGTSQRNYSGTNFYQDIYSAKDTLGYTVLQGDTVYTVKDTSNYISGQFFSSANTLQLHLGYMYRLSPSDKFNLSFGGGVDVGFGQYNTSGRIVQIQSRRLFSSFRNDSTGWSYSNYTPGSTYSTYTDLQPVDLNTYNIFIARPYIAARVEYRLSKKIQFFKPLNLFFEGRLGWEFSNVDQLSSDRKTRFLGLRFGINYYLSNIIGG